VQQANQVCEDHHFEFSAEEEPFSNADLEAFKPPVLVHLHIVEAVHSNEQESEDGDHKVEKDTLLGHRVLLAPLVTHEVNFNHEHSKEDANYSNDCAGDIDVPKL